jgi:pimeloyl-ACP methyl ester carboxylesterase
MPERSPIFRTSQGQAEYLAAYEAALDLWPVLYQSLHVPTRIGKTHVIASGPEDNPPLVLLPAGAMTATMWFPNVADLSRNYRVYAVDTMHDLGRSVPTQVRNTRLVSAEWLLDVLDALEIDKAYVVGASYGGWLTLNLALHAPDRVERIVLLAPAGSLKPLSWKFFLSMAPLLLFPSRRTARNAMQFLAAEGFVASERLVEQLAVGFKHYRPQMMAFPAVFKDDELQRLDAPALLLLGEEEIIYNPHAALDRASRLIPNIQAEIVPNVGHGLSLEQPELVNARILEFFTLPA